MKFKTMVSQIGKPRSVAEALDGRSTKDIAKQFGVSIRTAQRWKAGTQQPSKKLGGPGGVLKKLDTPANRRKNAANAVRNANGAYAGRVPVIDKSPKGKKAKTTHRNIGAVSFDHPRSRELLNAAAEAIERRDYDRAEDLLSEAVLGAYGGGAESGLSIEDWPPGFHLI